jgi:hypothetical protein
MRRRCRVQGPVDTTCPEGRDAVGEKALSKAGPPGPDRPLRRGCCLEKTAAVMAQGILQTVIRRHVREVDLARMLAELYQVLSPWPRPGVARTAKGHPSQGQFPCALRNSAAG